MRDAVVTALLLFLAAAAVLFVGFPGESLAHRAVRALTGGKYVPGEVISVEKVGCGQGRRHGVHLLLQTAEGRVVVNLGPSWFVDSQRMKVLPHDRIKVAGARVSCDGTPTMIATVVKKGDERLRLRCADGTPLWLPSRAPGSRLRR